METIITELGRLRISIDGMQAESEDEYLRTSKTTLIAGNKIDLEEAAENFALLEELYGKESPIIGISARKGTGLEALKLKLFELLDIIRIYTKTPSQKPDMSDPIVLERGSTLEDAAREVHKDFQAKLKYARIWGSGKHDGVMAKRNHVLQDGDIIELHV